jgi:hypothetical protein
MDQSLHDGDGNGAIGRYDRVQISCYGDSCREVLQEAEAPGTYTVTVDASNFAAGGALFGFNASPTLNPACVFLNPRCSSFI